MADQKLLDEIQKLQSARVSDDLIKTKLAKKGWDSEDITGALAVGHLHRPLTALPTEAYKSFVVKPQHRVLSLFLVLLLCGAIGGEVYVYEEKIPITLSMITSLPYIRTFTLQ
jgi:hypothetical protein